MAKVKIGNRNETFTANKAGTTYVLEEGKTLESSGVGIDVPNSAAKDITLVVDGTIKSQDRGIDADNATPQQSLTIVVGESGRVRSEHRAIDIEGEAYRIENAGKLFGSEGIRARGDGVIANSGLIDATTAGIVTIGPGRVINAGTIRGDSDGVVLNATESGGNFLRNSGLIESIDGTGVTAQGAYRIVNSGDIAGGEYGVYMYGAAGGGVLKNTGLIKGTDIALYGSPAEDRIINAGTLKGNVTLGDGDDVFVFKKGLVDGNVHGGDGADTYVIHRQGATILENFGDGFDFVKASVAFTLSDHTEQLNLVGKKDVDGTGNGSANHIQGNAGNNVLRGEGGMDFLISGAGNDRLFGGTEADTFNFQKGTGKDVVMDFEKNVDEIQLGGLKGATDFTDMFDNHAVEKNGDLWITYGSDLVILKDTTKNDLSGDDFVFG